MREHDMTSKIVLPHEVMLGRLTQSDDMREFFIEMWKQNPALAKQGGGKVHSLMSPLSHALSLEESLRKQKGVSLIELIIFIVIIGVALIGILSVMNQVTAHSADPLVRKQAIAAAESLLEEIELQDFIDQNDGVTTICPAGSAVTPTNRSASYHIVDCYKGFPNGVATTGIYTMNGVAITDLANYKATVAIDSAASPLGGIAASSAVRITVTVTDPQNNTIAIDGYRTKY